MGQGSYIPFSYRILGIIVWFLFTGPFAIYFAVKTPFLKKNSKIIVSVIMTAIFCWFCYGIIKFFCNVMADVQQLLGTGIAVF